MTTIAPVSGSYDVMVPTICSPAPSAIITGCPGVYDRFVPTVSDCVPVAIVKVVVLDVA